MDKLIEHTCLDMHRDTQGATSRSTREEKIAVRTTRSKTPNMEAVRATIKFAFPSICRHYSQRGTFSKRIRPEELPNATPTKQDAPHVLPLVTLPE